MKLRSTQSQQVQDAVHPFPRRYRQRGEEMGVAGVTMGLTFPVEAGGFPTPTAGILIFMIYCVLMFKPLKHSTRPSIP